MQETLKRAIDARFPMWRQAGATQDASTPPLILIEIEGRVTVFTATDGVQVFGAGHLGVEKWWDAGGPGACLKTDTDILDELGEDPIPGYLHMHRFGMYMMRTGIEAQALEWFAHHPGEYSYFIPVEFVREGTDMYPWRARPRRP